MIPGICEEGFIRSGHEGGLLALASASTDAGICLEIYKSLPPSDGCASGMAFMLINHGRFVFKRTHHGTCSKVFPGAVSLKWDLRLLALLSWGTWSRPFCGFPVLCGCLGFFWGSKNTLPGGECCWNPTQITFTQLQTYFQALFQASLSLNLG